MPPPETTVPATWPAKRRPHGVVGHLCLPARCPDQWVPHGGSGHVCSWVCENSVHRGLSPPVGHVCDNSCFLGSKSFCLVFV